ncbi:unnamed protein product [Caenorhabditis sp. 36 PRJEB53466]|nr:unnamed protein product [Caenorhabditis sp. 36 PRJEB53466]
MAPCPKIGPKKIASLVSASAVAKKSHGAPTSSEQHPSLNGEERAELRKLAAMLPSSSPSNCDASDVVLRAATYIDQLVATVQARVKNGTLPVEALNNLPPAYVAARNRRTTTGANKKPRRSVEKKR